MTDQTQTDPCRGMRKALYSAATAALAALAVAIPSAFQSCQASQRIDVATERAVVAETKAEATQEVVTDTAQKAALTGRTVERVAEQYVTRKELENALGQLGKQGQNVELQPQPIPVPPGLTDPTHTPPEKEKP